MLNYQEIFHIQRSSVTEWLTSFIYDQNLFSFVFVSFFSFFLGGGGFHYIADTLLKYSIFVHEKHGTELACGFLSGGIKFEYTELVIRRRK